MFGEPPELLIVISRSPAAREARRAAAQTPPRKRRRWPAQVSSGPSLNACARSPPFLQASAAKWLAIAALAPLPTRKMFCPPPLNLVGELDPAGESVCGAERRGPGQSVIAQLVQARADRRDVGVPAFHPSDDDLRDRHELLLGDRAARCSAAASSPPAPMLPARRDEPGRQAEAGRDAAQREVGVTAADRVDDAGAQASGARTRSSPILTTAPCLPSVTDSARHDKQARHPVDQLVGRQILLVQRELGFGAVQAVVVGADVLHRQVVAVVARVDLRHRGDECPLLAGDPLVDGARVEQSMTEVGNQHEVVVVEIGQLAADVREVQHLRLEQRQAAVLDRRSGS